MTTYNNLIGPVRKRQVILTIKINLLRRKYIEASTQIKLALDKWPNDIKLLDVAQEVYAAVKNWDELYKLLTQVELTHPSNLFLKRYLGTTLLASYRYEDALPKLVYCIENWNLGDHYSETLANTYARLAICYAHLERWELVDLALQKATEAGVWDPDIAYAYLLQYIGTGNSPKIQEFLDLQINKHPRLHALYYWKALYMEDYLHEIKGSIQWYVNGLKRISSFQPGERYWKYYLSTREYSIPWYILKRGVEACVRAGNTFQALWLIYFSKLTIWDSDIDIQIFRTYFNILNNSIVAAEKKCQHMLKKKLSVTDRIEYLSLLAFAQSKLGNIEDALSSINQALVLNSEDLKSWIALASLQIRKKDWDSAIITYQKVLKMNPFDFGSWESLGSCYINIEDLFSAQSSYEKAVKLNPFEADAWVDLANIYLKLGNNDLAVSAYQKGLGYEWLDIGKRQHALQILGQMNAT